METVVSPPKRLLAPLGCLFWVALAASAAVGQSDDNTRAVHIIDAPSAPDATELKADNPAGLSVQILPSAELALGATIAFQVTTKKPGYLILVDVDASGKLTQIYPNQRSVMALGARESSNLIKPGRAVTIPDSSNPYAGFTFVAEPPVGVAMVVAVLSDRPVQLLDLPDVPQTLAGQDEALRYLYGVTHDLRIVGSDNEDALEQATWSFDAKFYVIK
jgi:hypothetical protein